MTSQVFSDTATVFEDFRKVWFPQLPQAQRSLLCFWLLRIAHICMKSSPAAAARSTVASELQLLNWRLCWVTPFRRLFFLLHPLSVVLFLGLRRIFIIGKVECLPALRMSLKHLSLSSMIYEFIGFCAAFQEIDMSGQMYEQIEVRNAGPKEECAGVRPRWCSQTLCDPMDHWLRVDSQAVQSE